MGAKDHIDPEELRENLLELAEVILRLDEDGELLHASPQLIKLFGDLRSQLFEYEVRHTRRFFPEELPEVVEAQRIVHEAARRLEEEEDEEWWRRFSAESDDEEEL
jgi:hypothetical protein